METIGSINAVYGRVTGVDEHGCARVLRQGEPVCAHETLVAALDATATVRLLSGGELFVAPGKLVVLDADVFEHDECVDDGSLYLADVQRVLRWLQPAGRQSVA